MAVYDITDKQLSVGDFVVYATKTEAPSLQFAWVEEIKEGGKYSNKVKVAHADPTGQRLNRQIFGKDDDGKYGYQDTGRPSTSWLDSHEHDKRLLITQPI